VRTELPLCPFDDAYLQFFDLMLAGDVVGYGTDRGGIQQNVQLRLAPLGIPSAATFVPGALAIHPQPPGVGFLLGRRSLIVFSTWMNGCNGADTSCPDPSGPQPLWMALPLGNGSCTRSGVALSPPCEQLDAGPVVPLAVDETRIVVRRGDASLALLGSDGHELFSLPFRPGLSLGASLAGSDLVVRVQGALRDVDAVTGTRLRTWPLPDVPTAGVCGVELARCGSPRRQFEGAASGLACYMLDGRIHLLRLRDGADVAVADATTAELDDAGLSYAYRTTGRWPGRIRFVSFGRMPLQ
jgi:hypothetical protein